MKIKGSHWLEQNEMELALEHLRKSLIKLFQKHGKKL